MIGLLDQDAFSKLKTKAIKELFTSSEGVPLDYVVWAQADRRKSVQSLGQAYIRRQQKVLAERKRIEGLYRYEDTFYDQGLLHVAGIDEVGRGPIAGPVTVAAVILPPHEYIGGLNDSKKVSPDKRERLYDEIMDKALAVSCVSYPPEEIDRLNIYEATRQAMYEAVAKLAIAADAVLIDAMPLPKLSMPCQSIIKGDSKSANIAAASIIAKVTRDRYMASLEVDYPGYGFGDHKGYYTTQHKQALLDMGVTPLHRKSFEPIKSIIEGRPFK